MLRATKWLAPGAGCSCVPSGSRTRSPRDVRRWYTLHLHSPRSSAASTSCAAGAGLVTLADRRSARPSPTNWLHAWLGLEACTTGCAADTVWLVGPCRPRDPYRGGKLDARDRISTLKVPLEFGSQLPQTSEALPGDRIRVPRPRALRGGQTEPDCGRRPLQARQ
jgi:hypothetical protein